MAADQVNATAGEGGATPLHYAVSNGHEGCVRVLLQHEANVNSLTTNQEVINRVITILICMTNIRIYSSHQGEKLTPLDFCSEEFEELMFLLKSCGAFPGVEVAEKVITEEVSEEKVEGKCR